MRRIIAAVLVIPIGLLCLIFFQGLTDATKADPDPTAQVHEMAKDRINGYGLEGDQNLSEVLIGETSRTVIYEDRVVERFSYEQRNVARFGRAMQNFRRRCPQIEEIYVVPVPGRVLTERGFEEDAEQYGRFIEQLKNWTGKNALVADPWPLLSEHADEYVFFRTESDWTARGAYYGSVALCEKIGIKPIPLDGYEEHMYDTFKGSLFRLSSSEYEELHRLDEELDADGDPCFFYLLPDSKNAEEVILEDGSHIIEPVVSQSRVGRAAFIANDLYQAIVPGDGEAKETKEETILYLCDGSGRVMAPFAANYCKELYIMNIERNSDLKEGLFDIIRDRGIKKVVIAQHAKNVGDRSQSAVISFLMD